MLTRDRCKFNVSKVDRINGNHRDDELIRREASSELFGAIVAEDKHLHANWNLTPQSRVTSFKTRKRLSLST